MKVSFIVVVMIPYVLFSGARKSNQQNEWIIQVSDNSVSVFDSEGRKMKVRKGNGVIYVPCIEHEFYILQHTNSRLVCQNATSFEAILIVNESMSSRNLYRGYLSKMFVY